MQRDLFFKSRCKITAFLPIFSVPFPRKIGIDHKKCTFFENLYKLRHGQMENNTRQKGGLY